MPGSCLRVPSPNATAPLYHQLKLALTDHIVSGISSHGRSGGISIDIPINKSDVLRSDQAFYEVALSDETNAVTWRSPRA